MSGPGAFDTAGHGVAADATAGMVVPAQPLFFQISRLGSGPQVGSAAIAVRFADGVAASGQGDGFLVVHRHAGEGDADIVRSLERIGLAVHAFRIDIDEAHHNGGEWIFQVTFAGVAAVGAAAGGEPFFFRTPVGVLFRVPDVFTAKTVTESLESHRFVGHVAGEDDQVGPAQFVAVFFLDRPE